MNSKTKHILVLISVLFFCSPGGGIKAYSASIESGDIKSGNSDNWQFLPSARLSLDPMYIYHDKYDYSGIFSSVVEIDLIRYSNYILSSSMDQMINYSDEKSKYFNFHKINYNLEYLNLRGEFDEGILSVFIDHRCTNYINTTSTEEMITRWYGIGLRWESPGMTTGEKNRHKGVKLISDNSYLNYSLAVRKSIGTKSYPAKFTSDFTLMYNYYITDWMAAYTTGSAEYFRSGPFSLNRSIEGGLRLSYGDMEFSPYLKYEYITDDAGEITGDKTHYCTGIKAESVLYDTQGETPPAGKSVYSKGFSTPEIHLTGSYGYYIGDDIKNFRSTALFTLDLIKYGNTGIFFNGSFIHSSIKENNELYPAYIDSYYEGGISWLIFSNIYFEPLYRYTEYDEGNVIKSGPWDYQLAALRLRTAGFKPGFVNRNISPGSGLFFISSFEIEMTGGYVLKAESTDACWLTDMYIRWDICGYNNTILYLMLGENIMKENDMNYKLISEGGIRFNHDLVLKLFYRNELSDSEDRGHDISKVYHIIGIGFDF